jgi:hypothetical protein
MRGGTATDPMSQGLQGAAARRPSRRLRNRSSFDNELPPVAERQVGKTS